MCDLSIEVTYEEQAVARYLFGVPGSNVDGTSTMLTEIFPSVHLRRRLEWHRMLEFHLMLELHLIFDY